MTDYTINLITSRVELATNLLDDTVSFPSAYKLVITPNPGVNLLAREFKIGTKNFPMRLSYNGDVNSHTEWPSKFQWVMDDLGNTDTSNISGLAEFPTFYKIVFQDSNNLTNDSNWILNPDTDGNQIYVWIYFGKNETTCIDPLQQGPPNPKIDLDINRQKDSPLTEADTLDPITSGSNIPTNINSFNI